MLARPAAVIPFAVPVSPQHACMLARPAAVIPMAVIPFDPQPMLLRI
jgi:hypothetical protein